MIRVLICDDEPPARARMRRLLEQASGVTVVGEAGDGEAALALAAELQVDVAFLDIRMPGVDGLDLAAAWSAPTDPLVVFVTAYQDHAMRAFELHAVSYLVKPVEREQLGSAIERCRRLVAGRGAPTTEPTVGEEPLLPAPAVLRELARIRAALDEVRVEPRLVARSRRGLQLVRRSEVAWIQALSSVVVAHTADGELRLDRSIRSLEQELPTPPFLLARRGVLVNLDHVTEIRPGLRGTLRLQMADAMGSEITTSERQAKELRRLLD
ncbi:MAG: LytTR family DNA-binding domain-containing protein [bacterium]|nr:LytTR family DNA-binding domain-containing protein [bacterium]